MDNTETLAHIGYTRQKWTIQRHWQHWVHKIQEWTIQRHWQHWVHKTRMDNTETLATLGTQDKNGQYRHWQHWAHKTRMDNIETLATLGTQDKNGQYRDTGNIGYTRQEWTIQRHWQIGYTIQEWTIQRHWQQWVHKTRMDNTETLVTLGTQDKDKEKTEETIKNGQYRDTGNIGYTRYKTKTKLKRQSRMDNTETLATLGTQDKNGQYRDTGNIGYTRQEWTIQRHWQIGYTIQEWTIQRHWQHWVHKTRMDNTETMLTLGTQDKDKEKTEETIKNGQYRDTGNIGYTRQEWTIQRHWQHWVHKTRMDNTETLATLGTQDKNGQYRDTGNIGYTRYKTKTNKTNKIKHNTQN